MNYYIKGDAANADKIKAAFEKLGYEKVNVIHIGDYANERLFFFTENGKVRSTLKDCGIVNIIKTHPDYKELPLEQLFKVGDWVVSPNGSQYLIAYIDKEDNRYLFEINEYTGEPMHYEDVQVVDGQYHLWTIADAKDGDVLSLNGKPFIYSSHKYGKNYCYIDEWGQLSVNFSLVFEGNYVCPATKQERDLLFSKMREVGYEWDADKKELHKIKPHYDIANFKPFDKVLIRVGNKSKWTCDFFSYYHKGFHCIGTDDWSQCIPFEGNEHLLGTADMCPEEYINW